MSDKLKLPSRSEIVLYQTEDGQTCISVRLENETVWLTQGAMAELFQTTPQNITLHLKNIYQEGELEEAATCKDFLQVQIEGARQIERSRKFYNLEAILAVGYRVKSHRGTQFRRWATERLREYLVKGFVLDDQRLKQGRNLGADYFDELLERIRDIRLVVVQASSLRLQKVGAGKMPAPQNPHFLSQAPEVITIGPGGSKQ